VTADEIRHTEGWFALPSAYDLGKAALDELVAWADAHAANLQRNEATTRLHLIDRLLGEVLGWAREHIRAEESAGTGRIDYASVAMGPS
jgi:predicted type IV restriction endonuclease